MYWTYFMLKFDDRLQHFSTFSLFLLFCNRKICNIISNDFTAADVYLPSIFEKMIELNSFYKNLNRESDKMLWQVFRTEDNKCFRIWMQFFLIYEVDLFIYLLNELYSFYAQTHSNTWKKIVLIIATCMCKCCYQFCEITW